MTKIEAVEMIRQSSENFYQEEQALSTFFAECEREEKEYDSPDYYRIACQALSEWEL